MGRLTAKHQCGRKIYRKVTVEVLKPASGVAYLRPVNWKDCPFVCPEESVHGYRQYICERVIFNYKGCQEENNRFVNTQRCLPYECQDPNETYTDLTFHAEKKSKRNVSTFNGQMNFLLHLKKKHLPKNQDQTYRDNLVEQMDANIRNCTLRDNETISQFFVIMSCV